MAALLFEYTSEKKLSRNACIKILRENIKMFYLNFVEKILNNHFLILV